MAPIRDLGCPLSEWIISACQCSWVLAWSKALFHSTGLSHWFFHPYIHGRSVTSKNSWRLYEIFRTSHFEWKLFVTPQTITLYTGRRNNTVLHIYNHDHYILRLLIFYQIVLLPHVIQSVVISNKNDTYKFHCELLNNLNTEDFRKYQKNLRKVHPIID